MLKRTMIIAAMLVAAQVMSDTLYVPSQYPTIQAAVTAASPNDRILVAPGRYAEPINMLGKAVTVESEAGAIETVIDAPNGWSTFTFSSGEGRATVIRGFTIAHDEGGSSNPGMKMNRSSPTIEDCMFAPPPNWWERWDDVVYSSGGAPAFRRCTFIDAGRLYLGEGNWYSSPRSVIDECLFERSSVFVSDSAVVISESLLTGYGPTKIYLYDASDSEITDSIIEYIEGAAIDIEDSEVLIDRCVIRDNEVSVDIFGRRFGDRLIRISASNPLVRNTVFANNHTTDTNSDGYPFLFCLNSSPRFVNCTITRHSSEMDAPLIYNSPSSPSYPSFVNCIITDNPSSRIEDWSGSITSIDWSCIDFDWPGEGNINADPIFVDAGAGNYHLSRLSPCIDAGDSTPLCGMIDLDSNARRRDHPHVPDIGRGWPAVDMGAFEFQWRRPITNRRPMSR